MSIDMGEINACHYFFWKGVTFSGSLLAIEKVTFLVANSAAGGELKRYFVRPALFSRWTFK